MEKLMIGTSFLLGIVTMLTAVFAFLGNKGSGGGEGVFKAMGVQISGTGVPLFLIVGVLLVFSGFQWAVTAQERTVAIQERNEVATELTRTARSVVELDRAHTALLTRIGREQPRLLEQLEREEPAVTRPNVYRPSDDLLRRTEDLRVEWR